MQQVFKLLIAELWSESSSEYDKHQIEFTFTIISINPGAHAKLWSIIAMVRIRYKYFGIWGRGEVAIYNSKKKKTDGKS